MDEHTLRVLEFFKVRDIMAEYAASGPGRAEAARVSPSPDPRVVERWLRESDELREYLGTRREFAISGLKDIAVSLKKAAVEGASLRPEELLAVNSVARTSRLIKAALGKARPEFPLLAERSVALGVFDTLEFEINHAIGEDAEVLDTASLELKRIRRGLVQARARINKELEAIIQDPAYAKAVQEPVITMRGERYVLPLKQGFRSYLQGIVHDHSASGSTVFVEPEKTVEHNNRLVQLKVDEGREIERILWRLTGLVREERDALTGSFQALTALDVIYAKASYALAIGGHMPAITEGGVIDLHDARHPLLIRAKGQNQTVPLDVRLGRDFSALVITGPNTGGKTVVLKTIGLIALMAQAGMLIPASPDSALSVFGGIYSDIGDEQSVEQNLSTFSSHMGQIVRILGKADRGSLVLLDELGAGTDPAEGSALGVAIIEELHARGSRVVVTTHHGALKVFAANTQGVMNASVEFDTETLMPTYRLLIGRPGRSSALLVAGRLGMPREVISSAEKRKTAGEAMLDSLIERLEKEAQAAREDRRRAAQEAQAARDEKARLQQLLQRADEDRRAAVQKARDKASSVLSALRFKLRELEELTKKAAPEKAAVKKQAEEIKALEAALVPEEAATEPSVRAIQLDALSVGDTVRVYKYRKLGKVLAVKKEKGQVVVQLDTMKVTLGADELELATGTAPGAPKAAAAAPRADVSYTLSRAEEDEAARAAGPGVELNIIGLRVEEALERLGRYIDDCLLAGFNEVRIVHGRGTGALRKAVADALKGHRAVKSFHFAEFEAGGDAVTIVTFGE